MKTALKFAKTVLFITIILLCVFSSNNIYAVNMNLNNSTGNTNNDISSNSNINTNTNINNVLSTVNDTLSSNSNKTTTTISFNSSEITLCNSLSICLIAIGIVIILLGIAILIKMKKTN